MNEPTRAVLFGGPYDESFHCKSPQEYVAEYLESNLHGNPKEWLARHGPIVAVGYARCAISPKWIDRACEQLRETLDELFGEDFGGEDGIGDEGGSGAEKLLKGMRPLVESYVREDLTVWNCEEVNRTEFSPEQVMAGCPEFFK
jgi:hypothetical protein